MRLAPFFMDHPCRALTKVPSSRLATVCAIVALLAGGTGAVALAQSPPSATGPAASDLMKPLGGERYQIGKITVDRKTKRFTLPARVQVIDKPLEYLLTTTGGMKEYESLLEADVSGTEFNLACILLGLERDASLEPYFQFSNKPVKGPGVEIEILKTTADGKVAIRAAEALFDSGAKDPEQVAWVYVGSQKHWQDARFAADVTGTLIGFVHDPNTIIESVMGLGIGAYGSVNGNSQLLPPVGTEVELTIAVPSTSTGTNK
jgi:hypothetical protein